MKPHNNQTHEFNIPSIIKFGGDSLRDIAPIIQRLEGTRVLIVSDRFLEQTGVVQSCLDIIKAGKMEAHAFCDVQPDPTIRNVLDGLKALHDFEADILLAIGGGSAIDAAKVIAVAATNGTNLESFQGYHKIARKGIPLIAVPTTAGTGSEVTKVAVITDPERNVKMMMLDQHLLPTAAVVDYKLTLSMPASLTANVGVDTLTHGIEAYVSRIANPFTDPMALSCIRLVSQNLELAWNEPENLQARMNMSFAACQGGIAFANSSVCLVHGMSRPLGAVFHLPHGLSNAVLLPEVTRFSCPGNPERYADVSRAMGLASPSDSLERALQGLLEGLEALNERLEIPRLGKCVGVALGEFDHHLVKMAQDAIASGSPANNPVIPSEGDIVGIYRAAF